MPPLCSPAKAYLVNVLPLCSPVLPLSHFLLFSCNCFLASLNESVRLVCFGCWLERSQLWLYWPPTTLSSAFALFHIHSCSFPSFLNACGLQQVIQVRHCVRCHLISTLYITVSFSLHSIRLRWQGHSCLAICRTSTSIQMVKKKRTAAQFFDNAETQGLVYHLKLLR